MKTKIVIITLALLSLLLVACGSKESELEVPAIENETAVQEESIAKESTIEESVTEESATETLESESETMTEESITEISESETVPMTEESAYTISGIDKKMYVSQKCDSFQEPYDTSVIFGELNKGDLLHLTGEVAFQENLEDAVWYQFQSDNGETGYVEDAYLTSENPNEQTEQQIAQQPTQPEPTQPEQTQLQPEQTTPTQPTETTPQQTHPDTNMYDDDSEVVINPETGQPAQNGDTWTDGNGFIVEYIDDEDAFFSQYDWY